MSNIPSDIDMLTDAVQASPVSKNSDDKELSWSNVEDTEDPSSPRVVEPAAALTIDTLASNESSDDDMPPLVSDDEMPQLVESSDESDESDDEMPELVSDDDDIVHMIIRDSGCPVCRGAIQTLLNHEHNEEEFIPSPPKHEIPSMITYTLWLFILLHAFNLFSNLGFCRSR